MAETPTPSNGAFPCFFGTTTCFNADGDDYPFPLLPPPPPPSPPPQSSQTHMAPFLIATICILGISFLLLSTCTVILRLRFTGRRRVVSPEIPEGSPMNDEDSVFVDHPIWHITTVGLHQSVIDSITAFKYKKIDGFFFDGSDSSCSVCLTEFEEGDDLRLLPKCSHAFHIPCIDTWLRSHKNCPLCRAPVVNETTQGGNSGFGVPNSSDSGLREDVGRVNDNGGLSSGGGEEGSSHQLRERRDVLGELPVMEGIRIAEVLKKNRELRILSDLGENHRFSRVEDGVETVRRSNSLNAIAGSAMCGAMVVNEGYSRDGIFVEGCFCGGNSGVALQEQKIDVGKGGNKRGSSMSGLLMKSSSIGRSLQKGPISMKRSLSSGSRFFSFRRTKSQASVLPL
ncbi:hypothetical protein BVRB_6g138790 [Beta vulgaris subsp. vulgaris]|nr:hypothetical protein BVRB_6g138790 [Beta vulgaris subsp. vulgaris]